MARPTVIFVLSLVAGLTSAHARPRGARPRDDRRPTRSTRANMPRGFAWPPSRAMVAAGEACEQQLAELGVTYEPARPVGRVLSPMTLASDQVGGVAFTPVYSRHQVWDCQLVLAVASFAPRLYEAGVREVKYGSAFRWSKVRVGGRTKNVLSRHALGLALDIVSFVDRDGREVSVARDYRRNDELLLAVERAVNDSGLFRVLLTPRNDPRSHHDHFHLEANPDYAGDGVARPRPSS